MWRLCVEEDANKHNMQRHTLYYWSKLYTNLEKGKEYTELARTVTINILCFKPLPGELYHSMYGVYNARNQHLLTKDLEIHFIEMPKWKFQSIKEMKRLDRWLAYFTNRVSGEEMEEIAMREPAIQKAIEMESIFIKDQILRREYEQREKAIMDYNSAMSAERRIGYSEGREEGIEESRRGTALTMLENHLSMEMISECLGISADEVRPLINGKIKLDGM